MLSSKVLMVGNITKDISGEYYTVKATSFENVANNTLTLFGVDITPEILEKFGFTYRHIGGLSMMLPDAPYGFKSFTLTQNTDIFGGYWCLIITDYPNADTIGTDCIFVSRKIKHVHQLQNILFSLGHQLNPIL